MQLNQKMEKDKTFQQELIFLNHTFLNRQRDYMHIIFMQDDKSLKFSI